MSDKVLLGLQMRELVSRLFKNIMGLLARNSLRAMLLRNFMESFH
jgi:hypothetical protein